MFPQFLHMAISNFISKYLRYFATHHNHELFLFLVSPFPQQPRMEGARTGLYFIIFHNSSKLIYVLWASEEIPLFHIQQLFYCYFHFSAQKQKSYSTNVKLLYYKNGSFGLAASCFAFQYEKSGGRVERAFSCVTQIKLFTLDKLSNNIFCCLSVCLSGK